MLNTGGLEWRVAIERKGVTLNIDGQPVDTWTQIGRKRWARKYHVSGDERFTADQFIAREQVGFVVRWAEDISDINPKDRVVFPVSDTPADSEIYDVISVEEVGYKEALRIITARRAEA